VAPKTRVPSSAARRARGCGIQYRLGGASRRARALRVAFHEMFQKRRAATVHAQRDEQPTGLAEGPPADERSAREEDTLDQGALTLSTMCACGHVRRDHRGMRMEVCGPCVECDCDEFRPVSETLHRLRALLAQVERLQETAAGFRTPVNGAGTPNTLTLPGGTRAHSGLPDSTSARWSRQTNGRMDTRSTVRPDHDDHA
jgi:hypothetical protein